MDDSSPAPRLSAIVCTVGTLVLSLFLVFYNLDASLYANDEAIHARVVQEMNLSGNYLRPTFFGETYLQKPPFQMWLSAISATIFKGENWSYRIVSALCGFSVLVLIFLWSIRSAASGMAAGCLAVLFVLSSRVFLFDHGVRTGTQDPMLLFLTTAALLLLWKMFDKAPFRTPKLFVLLGLLIGLSIMTKWVAGLICWVILAALLAVSRDWRAFVWGERRNFVLTAAVSLVPTLLFLLPWALHDVNQVLDILRVNVGDRLLAKGMHNTEKPFLYLRELFARSHFGPSPLIIALLAASLYKPSQWQRYLLTWALVPLILYSCLRSRLEWYILPTLPAYALMLVAALQKLSLRWERLAIVVSLLFITPLTVKQAKKVRKDAGRIDADVAFREFRDSDVAFAGENVPNGYAVSRRQSFYLNALSPRAAAFPTLDAAVASGMETVFAAHPAALPVEKFSTTYCIESELRNGGTYCFYSRIDPREGSHLVRLHPLAAKSDDAAFLFGWVEQRNERDDGYRRSKGNRSALLVTVPIPASGTLSLSVFRNKESAEEREVSVFVNAVKAGKFVPRRKIQTVSFPVEAAMLHEGQNVILFEGLGEDEYLWFNWLGIRFGKPQI